MNHINKNIFVALCVLWILPLAALAKGKISPENEELLNQLDYAIEHKEQYRYARLAKADSLKAIANNSVGNRRVNAIKELYGVYERFLNDSALSVMNIATRIPEYKTDKDFRDFVQISLSRTYAVMGLFTDAFTQLGQINPDSVSSENRLLYYNTKHSAYGWFADFAFYSSPELAKHSYDIQSQCNDSIILYETDPIYLAIDKATRAFKDGDIDQCINIAEPLLGQGELIHKIYVNAILAQAYGKFGDTEKELRYLAKTSICDIKVGISEYMALHVLAQKLAALGETERAYSYIICALEDANSCGARLRSLEASEYFTIIDKGHRADEQKRKLLSTILYISLCLIVVVLTGSILSLYRHMSKLRLVRQALAKANRNLGESNAKLQIINKDLIASDRIKEEYITLYLNKCRKYLEAQEILRNQLFKLAQGHQWDELYKKLKSSEILASEKERFYADFDELFLSLYPDFIRQFNSLLKPEAQIVPKNGEKLTTELRIFALIKLGIDDSSQIAKFLSYSLTTIYNYRSRVRNNALESKDDFETKVLAL